MNLMPANASNSTQSSKSKHHYANFEKPAHDCYLHNLQFMLISLYRIHLFSQPADEYALLSSPSRLKSFLGIEFASQKTHHIKVEQF